MHRSGEIHAPAKINLTLEILARRDDGYHGVRTVMLPVGLYDVLRWEPADAFGFETGSGPAGEDNLVVRAMRALGIAPPLAFSLEKHIPMGGGLGGGSSDAAAVLRAAASGAFGDAGAHDYLALARALGSDVPFFLVETGALVEGTGERVTAAGALPPWWCAIVVPPVAVATAGAYAALDSARAGGYESRPRANSASLAALIALQRGDFDAAAAAATNDFEPVIAEAEPAVADALAGLRAAGARIAMLSGSGSCCFALAPSRAEAEAIASKVAEANATVHVVPLASTESWRS